MGQQQSSKKIESLSSGQMVQSGYRVTLLSPQYTPLSQSNKLNIMADYVIDKDPRLINLKELYQNGQKQVEFRVFNVLEYMIRVVRVEIKKISNQQEQQTDNKLQTYTDNKLQISTKQQQQKQQLDIYTALTKKPYTLGIKFKYYPKINDIILRISKVFKNSPLQKVGIKKDQYIVGIVQGDFTSIKQFVQLVKVLIQAQVETITLAVCNQQGEIRLEKLKVQELINWKQQYGVGYLGVELAQGWLNRLELRKTINQSKRKGITNKQTVPVLNDNISNNVEIMKNADKKSITETYSKQSSILNQETSTQQEKEHLNNKVQQVPQEKQKQEVDFFKNSSNIIHDEQHQHQSHKAIHSESQKNKIGNKQTNNVQNPKLFQLDQTSKTSLQNEPMIGIQQPIEKLVQKNQSHSLPTLSKSNRISQPLPAISCSFAEEQTPSSTSQVSSQQIQQKCLQLSQLRQQDTNVIKKTQNILQINFKGILKNQNIDDASTICLCKDYSKHCEKCFKQKDQNYYFFNKKTNKIYTIQKAMMFPKKG